MKNVFLLDVFYDDSNICTYRFVFSSRKAAERYLENVTYKAQIVEVPLITLSDFKDLPF